MQSIGLDLSKNHYGLCHLDDNGKTHFIYVYFKPFLVRDKPTTTYRRIEERCIETPDFSYRQVCFKYEDKKRNEISVDSLKTRLFLESLIDYLKSVNGKTFVVLEDYVIGTSIVQLVHVTESFKYHIADHYEGKDLTLFICANSSWKKILGCGMNLRSDDKKKPYKMVDKCMEIHHGKIKTFLDSLQLTWDIYKDLIDSYGLMNTHKAIGPIFNVQYKKRLFKF